VTVPIGMTQQGEYVYAEDIAILKEQFKTLTILADDLRFRLQVLEAKQPLE